jgi:6-pyruvoyl-tetrahydropterin synthase
MTCHLHVFSCKKKIMLKTWLYYWFDGNYLNKSQANRHEFENGKKMILVKRSKFLPSQEHILSSFWQNFHVLFLKKQALAVSQLTVTVQMMSNNRRSFSSIGLVQYLYDSWFFSKYVTPQMKNLSVLLFSEWLRNFFRTFCDRDSTPCLLDHLASEQWSPCGDLLRL